MKNGAAGKKISRNSHFPKALPWFNHGSTRRGKNAGKKIESALIWGRHLQKGLVKSVGFFSPPDFSVFFFFFLKTSFFNHPNTLHPTQEAGLHSKGAGYKRLTDTSFSSVLFICPVTQFQTRYNRFPLTGVILDQKKIKKRIQLESLTTRAHGHKHHSFPPLLSPTVKHSFKE